MHSPQAGQQLTVKLRRHSGVLECAAVFRRFALLSLLSVTLLNLAGCAAIRPLEGVPARYLPEELRGQDRTSAQRIDLSRLGQPQPDQYRVDSGDVLAVYIERVLGQRDSPPINRPVDPSQPPTIGYPLTVRGDGTLSLPLVPPINVRGRTIPEIEQQIRHAYIVQRRLLRQGQDRVIVSLQQPRQFRVLVVREESEDDFLSGVSIGGGDIGRARRGRSQVVSLPAYQNDVLHALVESGGLPGLDADNVVYVIRAQRGGPGVACQTQPPIRPVGAYPPPAYQPPQYAAAPGYGPASFGGPTGYGAPQQRPQPMSMPPGQFASPPVQPQSLQPVPEQQPLPVGPGHGPVAHPYPTGAPGGGMAGGVIRGQSPDASSGNRPVTGGIRQVGAWMMATPRQVAEHITGIPMPPKAVDAPPKYAPEPMTPLQHSAQTNMIPGGQYGNIPIPTTPAHRQGPSVVPACNSCGPTYPSQFTPQVSPGGWQPPSSWSNVDLIASGGLCSGPNVIRIPLRITDFEPLRLQQCDVILGEGDIVFIGSRDDEVFYTGGLLGGGEYNLPRDRNLDILEAIAIAEAGSQNQGPGGVSALNSDVAISPSQAVVLRRLPNETQVPILVDLYRARSHISERINIQPGDYIILQYTKMESVGAFIERHILESALFGLAAARFNSN